MINDMIPVQSSPQYLRGSGEREAGDLRRGEWRPLSMPLAPCEYFYSSINYLAASSLGHVRPLFIFILICSSPIYLLNQKYFNFREQEISFLQSYVSRRESRLRF